MQAQLTTQGWRFCFIGGIANFRWGTPRHRVVLLRTADGGRVRGRPGAGGDAVRAAHDRSRVRAGAAPVRVQLKRRAASTLRSMPKWRATSPRIAASVPTRSWACAGMG